MFGTFAFLRGNLVRFDLFERVSWVSWSWQFRGPVHAINPSIVPDLGHGKTSGRNIPARRTEGIYHFTLKTLNISPCV